MKKEDLIQYASTTNWIEDQSEKLYQIALEEYPEQFGNFLKHGAHFYESEIEDEEISICFEEGRGDWFEKYYFTMSFETFLNEDIFREQQIEGRNKFLKNEKRKKEDYAAFKAKQEKGEYERLKKKFEND